MKRKNKFILGTAAAALSLMALGGGVFGLNTETKTASALSYETAKYTPRGQTTYDDTTIWGCPDNFQIYMYGTYMNDETGTLYEDELLNWYRYSVNVETKDVSDHLSFTIYKYGSVYSSKSLSGDGNMSLCSEVLDDGEYTIEYKCRYRKNIFHSYTTYTFTYSFEVDKTSPTYTLKSNGANLTTGAYTNKAIEYRASDTNFCRIEYQKPGSSTYSYEYGRSYTVAATAANNGLWTFRAIDWVGNPTSYVRVFLDTIAPIGTVKNQDEDVISNGSATNEPFIYSATDARTIASVQYKSPTVTTWTTYPKDVSILKSDGWYYFRATDSAGNVSDEYRVYYDTTKPTGAVFDSVQARGSGYITNKSYVKYIATDGGSGVGSVYVKKPGSSSFVSYTNGSQLTTQGKYYFKAYDKAGNLTSTTHEITLDLMAPVGQLKVNGVNVASGCCTSKAFSYSATDNNAVASYQVKKPNSTAWVSYTAGTAITGTEGWYTFRAYDKAGNVSTESKIFYDASKPTVTLLGENGVTLTNGAVVGGEYIKTTAIDSGSGIASMRVWGDNYSSAVSYVAGTELTKEGRYYFDATNKAGITSDTYRIVLDKTAPNGLVYANGIKVANGTITNADKIMYIANDALAGVESWFVKKPNTNEFVAYTPAVGLTEAGKYEFYSVDYAGNQSAISTITIDRSIPTAQLYADGATITNGSYTNKQYIKFVSNGTCFVKKPGTTSYSSYVSGTEFYQVGRYEFYAQNSAGTKTDTYVVIIDRTPKTVTNNSVSSGKNWIDWELTWTDGDASTTAPITRITINGKNYAFGSIVYTLAGKEYNVVVYDAAGNQSTKKFYGGTIDIPTMTLQKEYWEVKDGWSDYVYSFQKYENALSYATNAEKRFVVLKTWNTAAWDQGIPMDTKDSVNAKNGNYYVYKSEDDPEKQVAYFTQERLDEVVKKYAEQTIKAYYYWEKEPESCLDGDLNAYTDENKIVATEVQLREGLIYTLDGVGYTELTITESGAHTLLIEDGYGGSVEFEIYILDSASTIQYALGNNSPSTAEFDRTYYFKDRVTVSVPFEGDEFAMFAVYDKKGDLIGYFDIDNACYIEESGSYTAVAYNHYGASKVFSFVVSMNAPEITITENTETKRLDVVITESVDKESNITFLEIMKSVDGGETWEILTHDDYDTAISVDTLDYKFRTSGIYKVTVMDEFRTGIDAIVCEENYEQAKPVGALEGVENGGITNTAVSYTWTDEAVVTLTKDGVAIEYVSKQKLTEDGDYVLTISNYDGYMERITFTIDTVVPEITLDGVEEGGIVNVDVSASFEDGATAELFKNGESLGSYLGGTKVTEDGVYRLVVKDKADNESAVEFTIDKTVDWNININEQGLANSVTATANESVMVKLLKDGGEIEYTLGDEIVLPGSYTLTLADSLGNTASRSFTIVQAIVKEFAYDFNRMPNFETVLISGEVRDTNYGILRLTEDGVYEIGVVAAGETYSFTVTVDGTAPAIVLNGAENGKTMKNNVSITTTDDNVQVTLYLNGEEIEYTLGGVLTAEGEYRAVAIDLANNSVEVTFSIDKTAPVLTLTGVEVGGVTNGNVTISAVDYATVVVYLNDGEIEYTLGDELAEEGAYFVQAWDAVGNVTEAAFTIDKSAPAIALKGVANAGKTNGNVTITVADDATEFKVFLNGKEISYKAGKELKDEGAYKATVKDELGNSVEVSFTIDKTAATLVLNGVENAGKTKGEVSLTDLSETATVVVVKDGETVEYTLGELLNEAGRYAITVTDTCGNVSEYSFEITKGISGWAITGIVVGSLVVIAGAVFIILKKRGTI